MSNTRNLKALEAAIELAAAVHEQCGPIDAVRMPGMRTQILRAADSVAANIGEGARGTLAQRQNFYRIARGSADEVGVQLRIARRTGAIDERAFWLCENKRVLVCKMLTKLIRILEEYEAYDMDRARRSPRLA